MRRKVEVILLNRLGIKLGSMTINTSQESDSPREMFESNKQTIKKMYPSAVKVKISNK